MGYLEEFQKQISRRDFNKFFQLWEEYCTNDTVDAKEFLDLLKIVQESDLCSSFGKIIESSLPLWQCIEDKQSAYDVLKLLIDLQTTNSELLGQTALLALESIYGNDPEFKERIRLVGLRSLDSFQGAISNYELLAHCKKGKFVYHNAGWGTSEIIDIFPLREQITLECENVVGRKQLTFQKAFRTLKPIPDDSFLARRFGEPDALEKEARNDPVSVITLLLEQLGPKTASDIKDEMIDLVIPEKDWNRWWQTTRGKLKKDPHIKTPDSLKFPFAIRDTAVTHKEELLKEIDDAVTPDETLRAVHAFIRDLPKEFKDSAIHTLLYNKITSVFEEPNLSDAQELQLLIFLETLFEIPHKDKKVDDWLKRHDQLPEVIYQFEIVPFRKQALTTIRNVRPDWGDIFLDLLLKIHPPATRDYLLKELQDGEKTAAALDAYLREIFNNPKQNPEGFLWYFQKASKKDGATIPYKSKEGLCRLFDSLLVLLHQIEMEPQYRDLAKKISNLLSAGRYAIVRHIFEGASIEEISEFLLLASKIQMLSDQDKKIFYSLACVVHPSLDNRRKDSHDIHTLWTTEESFHRIKARMEHIATKEMLNNAKEIEIARAHGDLRENSEYKFAKEKRAILQGELKKLSAEMSHARIITPDDIDTSIVCIGSIVDLTNGNGKEFTYTILGPWDADVDQNILSFQSKLAQAIIGHALGDTFKFREEEFTITGLKNYLNNKVKG